MKARRTKADQSEATRRALIVVGRELFATRGYANTFTDEVADRAGVTRGALYHHFRRKEDLFRAVYEDVERELVEKITARILGPSGVRLDSWERLRAGVEAFLEFCLDPAVQRITVLDAPSVLGWDVWREIDSKYGYGLLRAGLQAAMEAGAIEMQPVEPLAAVIFGGLIEGAMLIARSKDQEATRREVAKAVERLMQRQPSEDEESGRGLH